MKIYFAGLVRFDLGAVVRNANRAIDQQSDTVIAGWKIARGIAAVRIGMCCGQQLSAVARLDSDFGVSNWLPGAICHCAVHRRLPGPRSGCEAERTN